MFRRRRKGCDFSAEIQAHIEHESNRLQEHGLSEEEARPAARRTFGNVMHAQENFYEVGRWLWWDHLRQDVRFGLRVLRKAPGFTAVAVLTLALGIGATTAVFSLLRQVMLPSLRVAQPEKLWRIGDAVRCCYSNGYTQGDGRFLPPNDWSLFSWEAYKAFRASTPAFEQLAAFQIGEANAHLSVRRAGSQAPVATANGEYVSGNFFETFGISAWRGRFFTDADDREGAPPIAVLYVYRRSETCHKKRNPARWHLHVAHPPLAAAGIWTHARGTII